MEEEEERYVSFHLRLNFNMKVMYFLIQCVAQTCCRVKYTLREINYERDF